MKKRKVARTTAIERWCRAMRGTLRMTYEPEISPPWHGVLSSDAGGLVASGRSKAEVLQQLGQYSREHMPVSV